MKVIKIDLPQELESIELHAIGDRHFGDQLSDWEATQKLLKHILDTPNAYCILGGDLMDTAISSSVGDTYGANLTPMEQLKQCVAIFEPLAKAGKILCVLPGNHENRIYRTDGLDITALMAAQLGIRDRYSPTTALLFLRFGKHKSTEKQHGRRVAYTVFCGHGSGGGKKEGGKINRLADLAQIVDADVYICWHTHLPAIFRCGYYRVSMANSSVKFVSKLFVNGAASLRYGGYADAQGFKPAAMENPIVYLDGREQNATAQV